MLAAVATGGHLHVGTEDNFIMAKLCFVLEQNKLYING